ncbi:MAG TPA: hypothetical protein VGS80_21050 [Ktedonobacterales bacterium]|nr:hypothetical protein [Ktedonobacterales bacterium]
MSLLSQAIPESNTQAARHALPDGANVVVERVTGHEGPFDQEGYAARMERADGAREDLFAAENLIETLGWLRELRRPDFTPERDGWQPVLTTSMPGAEQPAAHVP